MKVCNSKKKEVNKTKWVPEPGDVIGMHCDDSLRLVCQLDTAVPRYDLVDLNRAWKTNVIVDPRRYDWDCMYYPVKGCFTIEGED